MHRVDRNWFIARAFDGSLGRAKTFLNEHPKCNDDVEFIDAIVDFKTLLREIEELVYEDSINKIDGETKD